MKILITGGAGYKGVKLVAALLAKGHKVTILDNFMHGFESILALTPDKKFSVNRKDIRDIQKADVNAYDLIYHLAAITSFAACEKNPFVAKSVNLDGTKRLLKVLSKGQTLVYASTTTFYGSRGSQVDESTKPQPVSVYDKTKYKAEGTVMQRANSISLRFASLFGISPRMRNDLIVHDFIRRAAQDKALVLYDSKSIRTFLHISDAISAYLFVLKNLKRMQGNIFNVGENKMNFSKLEIAKIIKKYIDFEIIESSNKDMNKRDYIINFGKIAKFGFKSKISLDEGIKELVKFYSLL